MSIKNKIIKLLGGFTPKEQQYYVERINYHISRKIELETEKELLEDEVESLKKQIDNLVSEADNIVTLSIKNKNAGDKVIVNDQEITSDSIRLLKGSPVEITIYDKDDKLYPNLIMEDDK